jgi:DNA polymerase (family 10)
LLNERSKFNKITSLARQELKNKNMSTNEKRYPYVEAYEIASRILEELKPHCLRIEIAGSLRRKKNDVGDIEIVLIPLPYSTGIFESGIAAVINKWEKVKGELESGKTKYTQRILPEGIKLDLFIAEEGNWGSILAIRTGSAEYSHKVLANGWVRQGFKSDSGYLYRNGEKYEVREEEDLFRLIGIPYVNPEDRNR